MARTKKVGSTPSAGELAPADGSRTRSQARLRGKGQPFKPGKSGNPSGRPKDVLGIPAARARVLEARHALHAPTPLREAIGQETNAARVEAGLPRSTRRRSPIFLIE